MRCVVLLSLLCLASCEWAYFKDTTGNLAGNLGLVEHADSQRVNNFVLSRSSCFVFAWEQGVYPELAVKIEQMLIHNSQQYFNRAMMASGTKNLRQQSNCDFYWQVSAWRWNDHLKRWQVFEKPLLSKPEYKQYKAKPKPQPGPVNARGWKSGRIAKTYTPDVSTDRYHAKLMLKLYGRDRTRLYDTFVIDSSTSWWGDQATLLNNEVLSNQVNELMAHLAGVQTKDI